GGEAWPISNCRVGAEGRPPDPATVTIPGGYFRILYRGRLCGGLSRTLRGVRAGPDRVDRAGSLPIRAFLISMRARLPPPYPFLLAAWPALALAARNPRAVSGPGDLALPIAVGASVAAIGWILG